MSDSQMGLDRERDHAERFSRFEDSLEPGHEVRGRHQSNDQKWWDRMMAGFAKNERVYYDE